MIPPSLLALCLAISTPALAVKVGGFEDGGNTLVSAMMMFLGNDEKVYIMDKAEGNSAQVAGHPAWASVWDIATRKAEVMDVPSNVFCASGMHLPNGSYTAFGGNSAVGRGGGDASNGDWDAEYQDFDGSKSIRILNPCKSTDNFADPSCQWFDDATKISMKRKRWYSAAEAMADGTIVLIGGFTGGGYILRNTPNKNPDDGAENTYEFFPPRDEDPKRLQFIYDTSGLNSYAHAFLMPSGNMFLQANYSSSALPDMPGQVIRVYPASGATAMLPLTPENKYTPTILFCGGTDMKDDQWGNFSYPAIDTWNYPASKDCQRITPEPSDGSEVKYTQDDDLLEGRSMGQFIILPDGKLLVVNGALNGTAGYAKTTSTILKEEDMPYGQSLANGPVGRPAIYDPKAPAGKRWSNEDASVLIAGSNPNVDVVLQTKYPTEASPPLLSYGGEPFDITIPSSSYSGSANDAAANTIIAVLRGGFTTHAMNMGQRFVQLNNTYTVKSDGSIVYHVSQMPPQVLVGSGKVEAQTKLAVSPLPDSVKLDSAKGSADPNATNGGTGSSPTAEESGGSSRTGTIVGAAVGVRRRASAAQASYPMSASGTGAMAPGVGAAGMAARSGRESDSSAFLPFKSGNESHTWNSSTASLTTPYKDDAPGAGNGGYGPPHRAY
ncbi:copper radical oxidase variant A [Ephemerocybe angulata]|uniref:Copper radical oxidase variant A n=1 Tax=Ephemerocybe angulata TaxID=980116 RepID=A0A8H6M5F7_9AGAR|nr:copper radical oxidase variant A [Tulosesus angulatus]